MLVQPTAKSVESMVTLGKVTTSRHFGISTMIVAGFSSILVAVIGLGWFATDSMKRLGNITKNLYSHPFAVSNAASDMRIALFQLRNNILQAVLLRNSQRYIGQIY
ncbi:MAG: hypothetical protein WA632_05815 [Gallionella sp.]